MIRPRSPLPHGAHRPARQFVRPEEVGPEDGLQRLVAEFLRRAGQGMGAVVEQGVRRGVAAGERLGHLGVDRGRIGMVQSEVLQPFGPQWFAIRLAPAGRQHAPAAAMQRPGGVQADARRTAGERNGLHTADTAPACCMALAGSA